MSQSTMRETMGYKLAILPVLLFNAVVGVCDKMLDELNAEAAASLTSGRRRAQGVFPKNGRGGMGQGENDLLISGTVVRQRTVQFICA